MYRLPGMKEQSTDSTCRACIIFLNSLSLLGNLIFLNSSSLLGKQNYQAVLCRRLQTRPFAGEEQSRLQAVEKEMELLKIPTRLPSESKTAFNMWCRSPERVIWP